ncbi:MAG: tRNA (adenosine(37)-N6)-threonylcarbamoyltransferase complex dimerization subunit type 1 TsaB [Ruminococcaceae bacterium]|nr:tRNA (adenosine(37)-N6)-threonylcarbamoyltransferase complex dimerization subunit type 1 TsaB [Oscillospiraceae bacterium]
MKILSMDTTADTVSVALCEDKTIISSFSGNLKRTHSSTLLPLIDAVLNYSGIGCDKIDMLAVTVGPGSFTGLRIGVATAKGLAFGNNIPTVGVSSLLALAYNFKDREGALVCPSLNARRNEVYFALFRIVDGKPMRLTDDSSMQASELEEILLQHDENVLFCGDGTVVLRNVFTRLSVPVDNQLLLYPSAPSVALAAFDKMQSEGVSYATELSPTYLKPSQAERERLERINK